MARLLATPDPRPPQRRAAVKWIALSAFSYTICFLARQRINPYGTLRSASRACCLRYDGYLDLDAALSISQTNPEFPKVARLKGGVRARRIGGANQLSSSATDYSPCSTFCSRSLRALPV